MIGFYCVSCYNTGNVPVKVGILEPFFTVANQEKRRGNLLYEQICYVCIAPAIAM